MRIIYVILITRLLFFFLFGCILASCHKDEDTQPNNNNMTAAAPVACFSVNKSETADSLEIFSFTNCSQNAVRYEWDFGDADYAPVANPLHIYNQPGIFIVRMTAYNSDNLAGTISDTITVGNYSLDKVVFRQTSTRFNTPFVLRLFRTSFFDIRDTLFNQSSLPITVQLADSSVYDFNTSFVSYSYREDSSSAYVLRLLNLIPSLIVNNRFDATLSLGIWDTAKVTLYYKIIYRP